MPDQRRTRLIGISVIGALVCTFSTIARAEVIDVSPDDSPADNIAKIEGAAPGDEVVVAPGTYQFRLYLEGAGTADSPIVIRAADPYERPVWDLDGDITANWPGSYGGGDNGRAIWQITGSHYLVSGIVLRHGTDGNGNGGGIRFKYSDHVSLHDCLFQENDNGIQGAGTDTVVEFCEFDNNGDPSLDEGSHNLYIHGGTITVRYCYIHDASKSQNMHIRANSSVFEYNWIARSHSYMGDMMPCTMDPCDAEHTMLLRGNVFVRGTPTNDGQVFVMYNDQGDPDVSFHLTMINNTVIGNGDGAGLIHFRNDTGDIQDETAIIDNNVLYDVDRVFYVEAPALSNWSASGHNNWLSEGTADTDGLVGSVIGTDPGFTDLAGGNLAPAETSPLVGSADSSLSDLPDKEYYLNEEIAMQWRWRASVDDIGAFESTTDGDPVGPYDDPPDGGPDADSDSDSDSDTDSDSDSDSDSDTDSDADADSDTDAGGEPSSSSDSCGCRSAGARAPATHASLVPLLFELI